MQRYIQQLIEDLHEASKRIILQNEIRMQTGADPDDELELEDFSDVEKFLYGDEIPISEITGIPSEKLPTSEKLSQEQQALLAVELENLLELFHFILDFPVNYPSHLRYAFIRKFWHEKHVALSFGESHIEFCSYNEEKCPFPGYCNTCKEVAEQIIFDEDQINRSLEIDGEEMLPF